MAKKKKQTSKTSSKKISFGVIVALIIAIIVAMTSNSNDNMANPIVVLETSKGNVHVELYKDKAPVTVENFLSYVNQGYYDGLIFHRVIPDFMVQGGGFEPSGKQKQTNEPIELETDARLSNRVGTIAMARTANPDSATSQFFINVKDNLFLDPSPSSEGYTVFGIVVEGLDVVKEIEQVETANKGPFQDWPVEDVIITKAYVLE